MTSQALFYVLGHAEPAGSKRIARQGAHHAVIDANKNAAPWKAIIAAAAHTEMQRAGLTLSDFDGPLYLGLTFVRLRPESHYGTGRNRNLVKTSAPRYPHKKPDGLKLARGVEDALTGIVYRDDALIIHGYYWKVYDDQPGCERANTAERVRIHVWSLEDAK